MKTTLFKIYFLAFMIVIFPKGIIAQESKSDFIFNLSIAHFTGTFENLPSPHTVYVYPVDPGLEVTYYYEFTQWLALGTGVCYQRGRIPAYINRFRFGEISIPITLKAVFNPKGKMQVFLSTAIYGGKIMHIVIENYGKGEIWNKLPLKDLENPIGENVIGYSESSFFTDLSFNAGISFLTKHQNEFSISPIVKWRIKDNWMKNYRDNMFYGIKISYQLNLKTL